MVLAVVAMSRLFAFSLIVAIGSTVSAAIARESATLRANRVEIQYVLPKNVAHEGIYRLIRERKVLERFREYLSPLRLPRVLSLKVEGCDGEVNAWCEDDAVAVCYEYLDSILQNAPEQTTPDGVTRMDAINRAVSRCLPPRGRPRRIRLQQNPDPWSGGGRSPSVCGLSLAAVRQARRASFAGRRSVRIHARYRRSYEK
jgi:Putative metallopeptidase